MIEIIPVKNLDSEITVPGSKYIANRVLIIAALANGNSIIKNVPDNEDINATIEALKKLGIKINKKNSDLEIIGNGGKINSPNGEINVKESGTLLRFITGLAALAEGKTVITGSNRIKERPISDLLNSLKDLGIECKSLNDENPPVEVIGGTLNGGTTKIKGNVSSQYISSLLLISPYAKNDVKIIIELDLVSKSYVDMTISLMEEFGIKVENDNYKALKVKSGQKYNAMDYEIPGDWSSANYFLAAAAIVPGKVKINGIDNSAEGEAKFADALGKMGCKVNRKDDSIEITGKENICGIDIDMSQMPDAVQTLAAVAVFANGTTRIKNIRNLKYKESNRINDTVNELKKLGINAAAKDDEIAIKDGKVNPAIIDSHNDHRMVMSFAFIGLKILGIKIENPECVNKSFPGFWDKLKEIGAEIKNE